ncbi:hypothetical protein Egran_01708 [Elaphomyces granulatus]|uniref:Zn(2)-C6 fungal-type domain-containing protein n=1 Tax=Elaphomyces granulatus TaxID=519963 RepID=A0A232M293_9EURO|nr:hypothetical protein Egran_01708 [Elaphomyces granulatus]
MESRTATAEPTTTSNKRPRSPSNDFPVIASKVPKTQSNHVQINYLARQYPDNLPLVSTEDCLPSILRLIGEYDGVLHRHESIAGNLGACPLGPILVKRFERLFDGPPRVLKSHGKEGTTVTWLDIVEFAKNKPEQFNLEKTRNGVRVCQFYTKQSRVEISEEDYVLIASGMPQKMIPPQPIIEDEEKELGALEILEKNMQQIIQMADQVSARARQLNHRLKNRRTAIISRRENDASLQSQQKSPPSPLWRDCNGTEPTFVNGTVRSNPQSPPSGFVAVNTPRSGMVEPVEDNALSSQFLFSHPNADNITIINGTSIKGASPTTRAELMKKFFTTADRQARGYPPEGEPPAQYGRQSSRPRPRASEGGDFSSFVASAGTVAIPSTPSSLLPQPKSVPHYERDDGGPYKMEMVARMEELQRGERILPPCDRCRRLHMDCLKNLTACMGCTKKHAKCSWKDVKEEELQEQRSSNLAREHTDDSQHDDATAPGGPFTIPDRDRDAGRNGGVSNSNGARADSTSSAPVPSDPHTGPRESAPRRAASEIQGSTIGNHDRRPSIHRNNTLDHDDDDPDANSRLMQAIRETVDHHARVRDHDMNGEREREREWERDRDRKIRSS